MINKILQFGCLVDKVSTLKDRSLKIVLETQELDAEDKALLFSFGDKETWCALKEVPLVQEDIRIDLNKEFPNQKSPSERLRNVLWVLAQKKGIAKEDFEAFRIKNMEKFIERVKAEIDKYE